jgi:hypothetical protein
MQLNAPVTGGGLRHMDRYFKVFVFLLNASLVLAVWYLLGT